MKSIEKLAHLDHHLAASVMATEDCLQKPAPTCIHTTSCMRYRFRKDQYVVLGLTAIKVNLHRYLIDCCPMHWFNTLNWNLDTAKVAFRVLTPYGNSSFSFKLHCKNPCLYHLVDLSLSEMSGRVITWLDWLQISQDSPRCSLKTRKGTSAKWSCSNFCGGANWFPIPHSVHHLNVQSNQNYLDYSYCVIPSTIFAQSLSTVSSLCKRFHNACPEYVCIQDDYSVNVEIGCFPRMFTTLPEDEWCELYSFNEEWWPYLDCSLSNLDEWWWSRRS